MRKADQRVGARGSPRGPQPEDGDCTGVSSRVFPQPPSWNGIGGSRQEGDSEGSYLTSQGSP